MIVKRIAYLLLSILILLVLDGLYSVIVDYNKPLKIAIVTKLRLHEGGANKGSNDNLYGDYAININDKTYVGTYNISDSDFNIKVGDTIEYRIRQRILDKRIRAIKLNGKKIQNLYGPSDYFTLFFIITLILTFYLRPKITNYFKLKSNEKINNIYNNNK
jgi:hypothetical protein